MLTAGRVAAVDGSTIQVTVQSVCVLGDSTGPVHIANAVRDRLEADVVELKPFV
jgi:5-oxoprolinase (ATP-hydrolysing) subunit A